MRMDVATTADRAGLYLERLEGELQEFTSAYVLKALALMEAAIKESVQRWLSGTETRKSGALLNSWAPALVRKKAGSITAGVFSSSTYARIHELGGDIHGNPYLTVPLKEMPIGTRARDLADLFVVRSKRGNLLLARAKGKGIEPVFALKEKVTIRPKGYLAAARKAVGPKLLDLGSAMLGATVGGGS